MDEKFDKFIRDTSMSGLRLDLWQRNILSKLWILRNQNRNQEETLYLGRGNGKTRRLCNTCSRYKISCTHDAERALIFSNAPINCSGYRSYQPQNNCHI